MQFKINCIIVDDEPTAREILVKHISKIEALQLIAQCENATEAFNCINKNEIDLVFLDINMPGISGISFAKSINKSIKIIFTTAYREYAIDGFNLQAVDYLLKPISFERFLKASENYIQLYKKQNLNNHTENNSSFIFIRVDRKMVKIDFDSILYIESLSDYLKIHCLDKTWITRETITALETKLPNDIFIRTHRSFIVALHKIESYTSEQVIVKESSIPISRSYKETVVEFLAKFE